MAEKNADWVHRYDFVFFYDVKNGNPNGDPDADNVPRMDQETGCGLVSDVCIKRKVRDYVELAHGSEPGDRIYVTRNAVLTDYQREAWDAVGEKPSGTSPAKDPETRAALTSFMCKNFYDIRTFGAVMTTSANCGQVTGPIQLCFSESVDPIVPQEMLLDRVAATNEDKIDSSKENRTFGRKSYVPYGLYRLEGFVSAPLAEKTGFSNDDLAIFWEALLSMFENDRSAARGLMSARGLYVFKHGRRLGNAASWKLFDLVKAEKKSDGPARSFSDYEVSVDLERLPKGVTFRYGDDPAEAAKLV